MATCNARWPNFGAAAGVKELLAALGSAREQGGLFARGLDHGVRVDRERIPLPCEAGQIAGSIFLTDEGDGVSRLRLLYVEPVFQGRGIGDVLVSTCVGFARSEGYQRVTLWTHSILEGARRIYAQYGFRIVEEKDHSLFGMVLRGETWALDLNKESQNPGITAPA